MGRINPLTVSIILLLVLCAGFVFPTSIILSDALALTDEEESELSLVVGEDIQFDLLWPDQFSAAAQSIKVSTTNSTGYTLSIETLGTSSAMVNQEISDGVIPTLSRDGIRLSDGFPYGYGYSLDGELFSAMPEPAAGEKVLAIVEAPGFTEHELTFGIRPDPGTIPGLYENTYRISAIANIVPVLPELTRDDDSLTITPSSIKASMSGSLEIVTTVTEPDLTADMIQINIRETACVVDSVEYAESGYLSVKCVYPAIDEPGKQSVTLSVREFTGMLHGEIDIEASTTLADIVTMQEMTA